MNFAAHLGDNGRQKGRNSSLIVYPDGECVRMCRSVSEPSVTRSFWLAWFVVDSPTACPIADPFCG